MAPRALARLAARIALEGFVPYAGRVEPRTKRIDWMQSLIARGPKTLPLDVFPV